jgi:hypothetical protein
VAVPTGLDEPEELLRYRMINPFAMGAPLAVRVPERVKGSFTTGLALEVVRVRAV